MRARCQRRYREGSIWGQEDGECSVWVHTMTPAFPVLWAVAPAPAGAVLFADGPEAHPHAPLTCPLVWPLLLFLTSVHGGPPSPQGYQVQDQTQDVLPQPAPLPAVLADQWHSTLSATQVETSQPSVVSLFQSPSPWAARFLRFLLEAPLILTSIFVHHNSTFFRLWPPGYSLEDKFFSKTIFLCYSPSPKYKCLTISYHVKFTLLPHPSIILLIMFSVLTSS